jgi:hypothetical protein
MVREKNLPLVSRPSESKVRCPKPTCRSSFDGSTWDVVLLKSPDSTADLDHVDEISCWLNAEFNLFDIELPLIEEKGTIPVILYRSFKLKSFVSARKRSF